MDLWEDDLLLDDDFSDEEEESEELCEDKALDLAEDGFADWADASDGAPENERLEEALAEERSWSRTSIPSTMKQSWRTRRKKPRPPAKNGSNGKFAQRLCGGWRKQPGRNRIF